MLDTLLAGHSLTQLGRIAVAAVLFAILYGLGARVVSQGVLLRIAAGFAIWQCAIRWLSELPVAGRGGIVAITLCAAAIAWRKPEGRPSIPLEWRTAVLAVLLLAPLAMALAPAVSQDAMIYHLRFPEMTLREGSWAYDLANSNSYYPAATSTLYLPALAVDPEGVAAQLIHFGFFVLTIAAAAQIAKRLGAPTGLHAALLVAALPVAAIVAGWSWADLSLLFALATAILASLSGAPILAFALLGLAASIKYTAFLAALPLVVLVFLRATWRERLAGAAAGLVVMSPWYVTNLIRTGNPVYPLLSSHGAGEAAGRWSGTSWIEVWSGYVLRPQTLDEDAGGLLFLAIAIAGTLLALRRQRIAAIVMLAMWAVFLPLTPAMRLLLPAVAATLVVAGAMLEQIPQRRLATALVLAFVVRGGLVAAGHNAQFQNPLPAAAGLEPEAAYVRRNFPPAALYARAATTLPANARVVSVNEVRLFRFPRPVTASRFFEPPVLSRYTAGAGSLNDVLTRFRRDGVTHLLIGLKPAERGTPPKLPPGEERLVTQLLRASRIVDREGDTLLMALP